MHLLRFSYTISHVGGKNIATADVLSRALISSTAEGLSEEDINLREIQEHQDMDSILQQQKNTVWKDGQINSPFYKAFQPYLSLSGELCVQNKLLLNGIRIVIPKSLRAEILKKLHEGHLGITKCRERDRQSVWWPGFSKDLAKMTENCDTCACENKFQRNNAAY